jgi:hypothetical protein
MALLLTTSGCLEGFIEPDLTPPAPPRGISTATGDGRIEIFWPANEESDLAGYHVLVSNAYDGEYALIGTTRQNYFIDAGARNGTTYYYAVTAFDYSGNESEPSLDVSYDTPRPEGYNVTLKDYRTSPDLAGYDFSSYSVGPYDDKYTDVFFEYYNGSFYLNVWTDSDILDMGYTKSLYEIEDAPNSGWSESRDARAIAGHTYVVWTWDNHFAKLRINSVSPARVDFDWAYQLQSGNTRLKRSMSGDREALHAGGGAKSRQ